MATSSQTFSLRSNFALTKLPSPSSPAFFKFNKLLNQRGRYFLSSSTLKNESNFFRSFQNFSMSENDIRNFDVVSISNSSPLSPSRFDHANLKANLKSKNGLPDHLILLVNGILSSARDWDYVKGELERRLGDSVYVHASTTNSYFETFKGIDVSGDRLAKEVREIVKRKKGLKKISVIGHSLGGLIARYAIGKIYSNDYMDEAENGMDVKNPNLIPKPNLAGLEPVCFITLASPHLGVRGKKQLPFLLGFEFLEKIAPPMAPLFVGRTGKQLFLNDSKTQNNQSNNQNYNQKNYDNRNDQNGQSSQSSQSSQRIEKVETRRPLLVRMAKDGEEGAFISALSSFQLRVLYANVGYDHMVGWRTSCIRRESELPKLPRKSISSKYRHVIRINDGEVLNKNDNYEYNSLMSGVYSQPIIGLFEDDHVKKSKSKSNLSSINLNSANSKLDAYHDQLEEEMIQGLQKVSWRRVEVSFREAFWPYFAHNNIHVKQKWIHFEGAGVISHLVDTILEQSRPSVSVSRL